MVYETKDGWMLYTCIVHLKGGRNQRIYFFTRATPKSGTPCDMPEGYTVGVNRRTSIPYLKRE